MQAVLEGASSSRDGTLCCQTVFTLLDTLQKWHGDAKAAAQQDTGGRQQLEHVECFGAAAGVCEGGVLLPPCHSSSS